MQARVRVREIPEPRRERSRQPRVRLRAPAAVDDVLEDGHVPEPVAGIGQRDAWIRPKPPRAAREPDGERDDVRAAGMKKPAEAGSFRAWNAQDSPSRNERSF